MLAILATIASVAGCADSPPKSAAGARPFVARPSPVTMPYSRLFNFEDSIDRVFISPRETEFAEAESVSGTRSATIAAGQTLRLDIDAAMLGRSFPGRWSLLGLAVRADSASVATVRLRVDESVRNEQAVSLLPGEWKRVWIELIDLDPARSYNVAADVSAGEAAVFVDDVIVADSSKSITPVDVPDALEVHRVGLYWQVATQNGGVRLASKLLDERGGFEPTAVNGLQAEFAAADGSRAIVDRVGRTIRNGRIESRDPAAVAHHNTPVRIVALDESCELIRNAPGDSDQDGFDDRAGVYRIRAIRPVFAFRLEPRGTPAYWPLVRVEDVPAGRVRATVEGALVERVIRLPDGALLLEVPGVLDRPARIECRVVGEAEQ